MGSDVHLDKNDSLNVHTNFNYYLYGRYDNILREVENVSNEDLSFQM